MQLKKVLILILISTLIFTITGCTEETVNNNDTLPIINTINMLNRIIRSNQHKINAGMPLGLGRAEATDESKSSAPNHSSTNVQVKGIDEGDIVKTDGTHLYQLSQDKIVIAKIYPVEEAQILASIKLEEGLQPTELFLHEDKLVIMGSKYKDSYDKPEIGIPGRGWFYYSNSSFVHIYNIENRSNPKLERELEVEGALITTRKKDENIYLITTKHLPYNEIEENPAPSYKDSALSNKTYQKNLSDIRYFPEGYLDAFVNIVALDITSPKKQATIETFLGSAHNIYMSHNNLFIALTTAEETVIHKFNISGTKVQYHSEGKVKGHVLNQFSMDEYDGYFRIATTEYNQELTNNLFVLDKNMKTVGKLENLAPTERIYSARFMGEKGYLVTFELVDPLFVIDLSNPRSPKVLGELKIPGFSNYLHPIDENHLLGIGRDTTVTNLWGRDVAIELGIRLTIFDVTDVNNPKEKHVEVIGGRGSYSEALYNHKSIHYHKDILAFPIQVSNAKTQDFEYGNIEFIGAYIYQLDVETGFNLKKAISHMDSIQTRNYFDFQNYNRQIVRIVSVEDYTYTISNGYIQIHDENYQLIKQLEIK